MKITVRTSYVMWESSPSGSARAQVITTREAEIEADPEETAAAFADRAHDLLYPRPVHLIDATPAQFRMNTCRKLCVQHGARLNEDRSIGFEIGGIISLHDRMPVLELRPVPLVDA